MDLQAFVDCCSVPCCVLSVERKADGTCGRIHIERSNELYKRVMGPAYYDGMPYEELVPQDPKFEDFCFRAAILGERMRAYVPTKALGTWTDQTMIPLVPAGPDLGYCQFVFEFTKSAEPERMASVSMDTATAVIKASITLLGADDFLDAVREVLGDVLRLSGAFGTRIMLIDHETKTATNFCERLKGDIDPATLSGSGIIPYDVVCTWDDMIGESNAVIVKGSHDMAALAEHNPMWVQSMLEHGVKTLVLIPLKRGGDSIGYLYVTDFDPERVVEVKELLELMSYILGSEVSNYLLMKRLEKMSNVDPLTGLYNRNAFTQRMGKLIAERSSSPFGIAEFDLNGLKAANDTFGHDAGDKLLVEAAELLKGVFSARDLYRTGGDEFVAMVTDMGRAEFEQMLVRLARTVNGHPTVSLAYGSCWSDGSTDMQTALVRADKDMYRNKGDFYLRHPELRSR